MKKKSIIRWALCDWDKYVFHKDGFSELMDIRLFKTEVDGEVFYGKSVKFKKVQVIIKEIK